jgi:lipopolysaccharide transport system permease protein
VSYYNHQSAEMPFLARYFADLMRYRHLCWNLVGSDLRARFRRSRLGILWAMIQPLSFALMIAFVYGRLFNPNHGDDSATFWTYAIYVFSGMIIWEYFSSTVMGGLDALTGAQGYLRQARVPFFVFQLRVSLSGMVILAAGVLALLMMMVVVGQAPKFGPQLLLIPFFLVFLLAFVTPLAMLLSIVGTQFRDLRYISIIALQALFFLSPVMLVREFLESDHLVWLKLGNPLVPMLDMFRDPVLYGRWWELGDVGLVLMWIVGLWASALVAGASFGRRVVFAI